MYLNTVHIPGGITRTLASREAMAYAVITRSRRFPAWSLVGMYADADAARAYVTRQNTPRARRNNADWAVVPAESVRVSPSDMAQIRRVSA